MNCLSCGAKVGESDTHCPYCGAITAHGSRVQHQQQQLAAHREALGVQREHAEAWQQSQEAWQRKQEAKASLARTSKHALIWSGAGVVVCCAFAPSVVGVVMGLRARKMAKKYELVLPVTATIGLILGVMGVLLGALLLSVGILDGMERDDRLAAIAKELGDSAAKEKLDHRTACLLAERRLLQGGFRDDKTVENFECDGQLSQDDRHASLINVRFERGGDLLVVTACLERGARWSVQQFRLKATCDEPDDTAKQKTSKKREQNGAQSATSADDPQGSTSATSSALPNSTNPPPQPNHASDD